MKEYTMKNKEAIVIGRWTETPQLIEELKRMNCHSLKNWIYGCMKRYQPSSIIYEREL